MLHQLIYEIQNLSIDYVFGFLASRHPVIQKLTDAFANK